MADIQKWIEQAPLPIIDELRSVPVMNFLRNHRNHRFQMIGAYDGAMSEDCKELNRIGYLAMDELVKSLETWNDR